MFKIVIYKNGFVPPNNKENENINDKIKNKQKDEDNIHRSVRRSRTIISDYVLANDFDLFVTFTFDPKKVDRYNMAHVYTKMQRWLWRTQRETDGDFRYVIVPERHKDGALHFHALLGGYTGTLKKTNVIQNNKFVYNVSSFKSGFTNAQYIDPNDKQKTTAYLCKYITKDMALVASRRRYWCSKNLKLPIKFYNKLMELGLTKYIQPKTMTYETEYNVMYEVPKDLFV